MISVRLFLFTLLIIPNLSSAFFVTRHHPKPTMAPNRVPNSRHHAFSGAWSDAGALIDEFYQTQPYMAAFLTCSFKASAADFMAQTRQVQQKLLLPPNKSSPANNKNNDDEHETLKVMATTSIQQKQTEHASNNSDDDSSSAHLDLNRNLGFICYGGLYQGIAQQFLFNYVYPSCFPMLSGWSSVFAQVALDMAIVGPFVCLPLAYVAKALFTSQNYQDLAASSSTTTTTLIHENSLTTTPTTTTLTSWNTLLSSMTSVGVASIIAGLDKYRQDVQTQKLLLKYWALWIPVQSLTFGVIPAHYRVAFVAAVSFFWVFILSTIAASSQETNNTTETSPQTT